MRSGGNRLIEAVEELLRISREANIPAEIYHLKAAGKANWGKIDQVLAMVEKARRDGRRSPPICIPIRPGRRASMRRCRRGRSMAAMRRSSNVCAIRRRKKLAEAIRTPTKDWENLYLAAGTPERILLVGFKNEKLKPLTGKTLAEVAKMRNQDPVETIMDLVLEDGSRVGTVYFMMSEENIKKQIRRPWVSFGSDAGSMAPEGIFLKSSTHPRAYGNFSRLLGKYVREESDQTRGCRLSFDRTGDQSRTGRTRVPAGREVCGCRHLRSADDRRSGDV